MEVPPERKAVLQAQTQTCGLTVQEGLLSLADQSGAVFGGRDSAAAPRPISEKILDNMSDVPREEFARLPKDGSSQHDHDLYVVPSMSIDISHKTEARLTDEARRQGVSVDPLLERLMSERGAAAHVITGDASPPGCRFCIRE